VNAERALDGFLPLSAPSATPPATRSTHIVATSAIFSVSSVRADGH